MSRANGEPPERLSILHLLAGSDPGGLSRYVFDLCSALHCAGPPRRRRRRARRVALAVRARAVPAGSKSPSRAAR